jgi:hypothetical protein
MHFIRLVLIVVSSIVLGACGEEVPEQPASIPPHQSSTTHDQPRGVTDPQPGSISQSAGGVTVKILPANPTSTGCLRAVIQGHPGRSAVIWKVNGETVSSGTDTQLCSDSYRRYDQVSVAVGTNDKGAQASTSIGNSPPRVVDITSTPEEIFAGTDISVAPLAEDADGDDVDFTYQWLINGEADPALTEATLPGSRFSKGDAVKVLIVPNDFYDDGPTYESYAMQVPNAAPRITSQPPQRVTSLDYRYQVEVSDPDDNQFTYRLEEAPEGMTIDETSGLIQWSLVEATPGDHTIAIIVTDPEGVENAQEYTLTLSASQ